MEKIFSFHGETFFLPWRKFFLSMEDFFFPWKIFSSHGGYSEPEAVLAIERMAREASQSESGTAYRALTPQAFFAYSKGRT